MITISNKSDVKSGCVYAIFNKCLLIVNTTDTTYLTIEEKATGEQIADIELARYDNECVVDIAPFIQSFFSTPKNLFYTQTLQNHNFEIVISSNGESLDFEIVCLPWCLERGQRPMLADKSALETHYTSPVDYWEAEAQINYNDTLLLPTVSGLEAMSYKYVDLYGETIHFDIEQITDTTAYTTYTKFVRQLPYCDDKLVVKYLNQRSEFEYFMFDKYNEVSYEIEKGERVYNQLTSNIDMNNGDIQYITSNKSIVANTMLMDDVMTRKAIDLIKSKRVYLLVNPVEPNPINSWLEVDLQATPNIATKRNMQRMSCTITINENVL
ncbi:MAG: hypothetical protein MJ197_08630 [Bacteroidales bacterium]|nr:hypothetical protein [Bacteroidales bacterium]